MKKINTKVLKAVEYVTRNEAKGLLDDWPLFCMGIFHQPKRPVNQKSKKSC